MREFLTYFKYLKSSKLTILTLLLMTMFVSVLLFCLPWVNKFVYDDLLKTYDKRLTYTVFIIIFSLVFIISMSNIFISYVESIIKAKFIYSIRIEITKKILSYNLGYFRENEIGDIVQKVIPAIDIVGDVLIKILKIFAQVMQLLIIMVLIYFLNRQIFIVYLIMILLTALWTIIFKKPLLIVNERIGSKEGSFYSYFFNLYPAIKQVKCFNLYKYQELILRKRLYSLKTELTKSAFFYSLLQIGATLTLSISELIIYGICFYQISTNSISIGVFITILGYSSLLINSICGLTSIYSTIQNGIISSKRVRTLLDEKKEECEGVEFVKLHNSIEFKNLTFSYQDDSNVLNDINIKLNVGTDIAFVGHSGSGKSTLISILMRVYEVNPGMVFVDGTDINSFNINTYRNKFSILSQDAFLFNDSIRNNIDPLKKYSDTEIIEVCNKVQLENYLSKLPKGINTVVGERGVNISGGEKQRICFARTLLRSKNILIFDEATSALDPKTEKDIRTIITDLRKQDKSITTITISHRLESVKEMDKIFVLREGYIIESGTYDSLNKNDSEFKRLFYE